MAAGFDGVAGKGREMLVEIWDLSIPSFVEIPDLSCAGACSVQFANEFCGTAISEWTFWTQGSSGFGTEDCSKASAQ